MAAAPTPSATIYLLYPPALRPYAQLMAGCAQEHPEATLFLSEISTLRAPQNNQEILLSLGNPEFDLDGLSVFQLGVDRLAIIANSQNPVDSLTPDDIKAIFTTASPVWPASGEAVNVWVYPSGDDLRTLFDMLALQGGKVTSQAWLAPNPQAMLEAISADPLAVGYLLASWLDSAPKEQREAIKDIPVEGDLAQQLIQPLLAITTSHPEDLIRTLLLCLQGK